MVIEKETRRKYRLELEKLQKNSRAVKILKNLFELNWKNPNRINNNLIKLVKKEKFAKTNNVAQQYNNIKKEKINFANGNRKEKKNI